MSLNILRFLLTLLLALLSHSFLLLLLLTTLISVLAYNEATLLAFSSMPMLFVVLTKYLSFYALPLLALVSPAPSKDLVTLRMGLSLSLCSIQARLEEPE